MPYGPLLQVLPPGAPVPPPAALEAAQVARESGYLREAEPIDPVSWGGDLANLSAGGWSALAEAFRRGGDEAGFARCAARAAAWVPPGPAAR